VARIEQIELVLGRQGRVFTAQMLWDDAPQTCGAIASMLERDPIVGLTYHSIYSGHEFYVYCPSVQIPLENHIVYPKPGQLVYYYLPSKTYASMHVHKERMGDVDTAEVAIWYGPGDLRIVTETGIRGNLFAAVRPEELDAFYAAGNAILAEGREELTITAKV
jgi:Protein of unknown function (DUF3830)